MSNLAGEIFPVTTMPEKASDAYAPLPLLDDDGAATDPAGEDERATAERVAGRLRQIRRRAERSGLLAGTSPEQADSGAGATVGAAPLEAFALPAENLSLSEQVAALVAWMSDCADQVVVLDELGYLLGGVEAPAGLRGAAVRLAQSWERSQPWLHEDLQAAQVPTASACLSGGRILSVIGVRGSSGFFCAALVGGQMVSQTHAAQIRDAMALLFC
ncbi:MAG: hypothetical protein ACR2RV_19410 [Verrucomicrobiales bacterium]